MVAVEITYSRTQEELQAIQTAWGENGIKSRVTAALERVEPAITLQVTNYQPVNLDLFVRTYYEDHLETIMECPQVKVGECIGVQERNLLGLECPSHVECGARGADALQNGVVCPDPVVLTDHRSMDGVFNQALRGLVHVTHYSHAA